MPFTLYHSMNIRTVLQKVSKFKKQFFLILCCPKKKRNIRQNSAYEQNFVKYFVLYLGNGVSRKNTFEIYWPLVWDCTVTWNYDNTLKWTNYLFTPLLRFRLIWELLAIVLRQGKPQCLLQRKLFATVCSSWLRPIDQRRRGD